MLFGLSRNVCAMTCCENHLTERGWRRTRARIAHIRGEKLGAARYDPSMTDEERRAFENLILICPNCHDIIDELEPETYTVEKLEGIKEQHELLGVKTQGWLTEERLAEVTAMIVEQLVASGKFLPGAEGSEDSAGPLDIRVRGTQATETSTAMPGTPIVTPREDATPSPATVEAKVQLPTATVAAEKVRPSVDLEVDDALHLHDATHVELTTDDASSPSATGESRSSGTARAARSHRASAEGESQSGGSAATH